MEVVRIENRQDGTYAGYIYSQLVSVSKNREDVVRELNYKLPGEEIS